MPYPTPYPPRPAIAAHTRQEWLGHIQDLIKRSRRDQDPEADPHTPPWELPAARAVTDFMHERVTAAIDAVTGHTEHRARLADAEATRDQLRRDLDLLRDNVRTFMADSIATQAAPDRADANAALRGWGIDPLPARYTVTLTVTLDATVIADDDEDAEGQAHQILQELVRDRDDETVELGDIHTDQISEHDQTPDLTR